jgi:hypothetical protein
MTMRNRFRTGLAALTGLSVLAVTALAAEEKISPKKLPAAVRKAVKKKFPEAKYRGAAKEVADGKTTYEVELTVEGRAVDAIMSPEGKILEVEREVPVAKLPAAVKKALAAKYPGAKIEKAETLTKGEDGPLHYEIVIKTEVVLTPKGKVVGATEEDEDDEKPSAKAKSNKDKDDEDDEKAEAKAKKKEKGEDEDDEKAEAKAKKKEKKEDEDDEKAEAKVKKKEKKEDEDDEKSSAKAKKKEKKEDEEDDDDR